MIGDIRLFVMAFKRIGFPAFICVIFFLKLWLVFDIEVAVRFSPFDDSLYVSRAYNFLNGVAWGPYDPYVLAKLPGMSLWLILSNFLSLPYLVGLNILYGLVGAYLLLLLWRRFDISATFCIVAYLLYMLNPVTFVNGWFLVMREALSSVLFLLLIVLSLHLLIVRYFYLRFLLIVIWSLVFSFSQLLREEDVLLWLYLGCFIVVIIMCRDDLYKYRCNVVRFCLWLLIFSSIGTFLSSSILRSFNDRHYGQPLLSDFTEGEFPRLVASIRSIQPAQENRLVMIPQDVIGALREKVPDFAPVLDLLPNPGPMTISCKLHGVCDNWSNGWMLWWIKQASFESGLTPSLEAGQEYFRNIRMQIEALCSYKSLDCVNRGAGVLPPLELRWFRAYFESFVDLSGILLFPGSGVAWYDSHPPSASSDLIKKYEYVTLTNFSKRTGNDAYLTLKNEAKQYGPNVLAMLIFLVEIVITFGIILGTLALIARWMMFPGVPLGALYCICLLFWAYTAGRLLALAYVGTFFGPFEPRILFSSYIGMSILCPIIIWESLETRRVYRRLES